MSGRKQVLVLMSEGCWKGVVNTSGSGPVVGNGCWWVVKMAILRETALSFWKGVVGVEK